MSSRQRTVFWGYRRHLGLVSDRVEESVEGKRLSFLKRGRYSLMGMGLLLGVTESEPLHGLPEIFSLRFDPHRSKRLLTNPSPS